MADVEHGNADRTQNSGRGIHTFLGHSNVANGAARAGITQGATDNGRWVQQTAGDVPGYFMGDGSSAWYRLDTEPFVVTPGILAADTHDYEPVSAEAWQYGQIFRITSNAAIKITGFENIAAAPRRIRHIYNVNAAGGFDITIGHNDSGSSAGKKVFIPNQIDMVIPPGGNVAIWEDTLSSVWRPL